MRLTIAPLSEAAARAVLGWRYAPPYQLYNTPLSHWETDLRAMLDPANHYVSLGEGDDALVAYGCFGRDAQVPGGDYNSGPLDIGLMLRPDLTGQGKGIHCARALVGHAACTWAPQAYRVTIAAFNLRAQTVWSRAGFTETARFARLGDGLPFVILERPAQPEDGALSLSSR